MHDNTTNKQWDVMTNAERAASAINPNNVVFTGPCTTAHAPFVLTGPSKMWVNRAVRWHVLQHRTGQLRPGDVQRHG